MNQSGQETYSRGSAAHVHDNHDGAGGGVVNKRMLVVFSTAALLLALASLVWAQSVTARLRGPGGDSSITVVQQGGVNFFPVDSVIGALGGAVQKVPEGYKARLKGLEMAFNSDSRYAVFGDQMIEMPQAPLIVEGRPFAPLELFAGFLRVSADIQPVWDPASSVLDLRPLPRQIVEVSPSVVDLQNMTKIVLQLSGKTDFSVRREPAAYIIELRSPIRAPFAEQSYDSAFVSRLAFQGQEIRIDLKSPQTAGDTYRLENPFRIVLDLKAEVPRELAPPPLRIPSRGGDLPGIHTIVLDPGHGGKEVGAIGPAGLMEKDVTLALARKLSTLLQASLGARVVLTRDSDKLVSLDERTAIANQYRADLFLSIHLNASLIKGARGAESYFLSADASDELSRSVAERENSSAAAASPNSDLKMILWDLAQQEYLTESSRLAEVVLEEMNRATGSQSRGVKQAPFKVLVGATMPAALVEVGFISNAEEETKLGSEQFQDALASALMRGIQKYKLDYETRAGIAPGTPTKPTAIGQQRTQMPATAATPAGQPSGEIR